MKTLNVILDIKTKFSSNFGNEKDIRELVDDIFNRIMTADIVYGGDDFPFAEILRLLFNLCDKPDTLKEINWAESYKKKRFVLYVLTDEWKKDDISPNDCEQRLIDTIKGVGVEFNAHESFIRSIERNIYDKNYEMALDFLIDNCTDNRWYVPPLYKNVNSEFVQYVIDNNEKIQGTCTIEIENDDPVNDLFVQNVRNENTSSNVNKNVMSGGASFLYAQNKMDYLRLMSNLSV